MQKTCRQCQNVFEVLAEDLAFYDKVSPLIGGRKFEIPPPGLCAECRLQARYALRNERKLYHRKCDLTGKQIISMYSPDKPYKVYAQNEWWSDKWDPFEFGRDFDFNRAFFDQLEILISGVPRIALYTKQVENSEYTNYSLNYKNCYLVFGGANNEDCLYGKFVTASKNAVDSLSLYNCELCYEGVASEQCYNCCYFVNCRNCRDSWFIEDCAGCKNCILCFGLRSKEYYILNQYVGKEKFEEYKEGLKKMSIGDLRLQFAELKANLPHLQSHIYASENCTGDMIFNSRNCFDCYDIVDSEDSKLVSFMPKAINSMDCTFGTPDGVEASYNLCSSTGTSFSIATFLCWNNSNIFYSQECHNSANLFGCIGLRNKQYCILNKQYTKEEYEALLPRIIEHMQKMGEWGEFFPVELSHFGYNETVAFEYFPLAREEVLRRGWKWHEEEAREQAYLGPKVEIADDINQVTDAICDQILICEATGKPYKIIPQELKFYREMGLPIPRKSPDERHRDRMALRNPRKLWERACAKCGQAITTTYSPQRTERVYCEECYLKEVY